MLNVGLGPDSNPTAIAAGRAPRGGLRDGRLATRPRRTSSTTSFEAEILRLSEHEKVRAIGETGIDHYRETATRAEQRRAFEAQIEIARERGLPIVIHARDRDGETTATDEVLRGPRRPRRRRRGDPPLLPRALAGCEDAIERGWYCSFSGIVTYPASDALREAAAELPAELLLVETDAPYLAPQPVRGKPNEPAHVVATARDVAEVARRNLRGARAHGRGQRARALRR